MAERIKDQNPIKHHHQGAHGPQEHHEHRNPAEYDVEDGGTQRHHDPLSCGTGKTRLDGEQSVEYRDLTMPQVISKIRFFTHVDLFFATR